MVIIMDGNIDEAEDGGGSEKNQLMRPQTC
jgi:hypothetical protein